MTTSGRVLQALDDGPATAGELGAELDMPNNTVSANLCYLMRTGRVTRTMHKRGYQRAYLWRKVDEALTSA